MGQYFKAINVTKQEVVCPWCLGTGAKLWEWAANPLAAVFTLLLRKSDASGGGDYTSTSGLVTFAPGETSKQITVVVSGDTNVEPNETFSVSLSNAVGATIGDGSGQATISNDDTRTLAVNNVTLAEGNSGTTDAVFTVTLSAPSSVTTTVSYTTANGTATAGSDYQSRSGSLSFAPGETASFTSGLGSCRSFVFLK